MEMRNVDLERANQIVASLERYLNKLGVRIVHQVRVTDWGNHKTFLAYLEIDGCSRIVVELTAPQHGMDAVRMPFLDAPPSMALKVVHLIPALVDSLAELMFNASSDLSKYTDGLIAGLKEYYLRRWNFQSVVKKWKLEGYLDALDMVEGQKKGNGGE